MRKPDVPHIISQNIFGFTVTRGGHRPKHFKTYDSAKDYADWHNAKKKHRWNDALDWQGSAVCEDCKLTKKVVRNGEIILVTYHDQEGIVYDKSPGCKFQNNET